MTRRRRQRTRVEHRAAYLRWRADWNRQVRAELGWRDPNPVVVRRVRVLLRGREGAW